MTQATYSATGNHVFARLVNMLNKAAHSHYDRLLLADGLLKDRAWVEDPAGGGGDENKAIDRLERKCFGDVLDPAFGLPAALDVLHHVPDVKDWAKFDYSLRRVWADWKARTRPAPKVPTYEATKAARDYTPPLSFPDLTPGRMKDEYERVYAAHEKDADKIARLEAELARWKERALEAEKELEYYRGAASKTA